MKTPEKIKRDMAECAKRAKEVIMYSCDVWEMAEYTETVKNTLIVGCSLLRRLEQDNAQKGERITALEREKDDLGKELDKMRLSFAQQTARVAEHDCEMLKAVQKAISNLPRWISVEERLPDHEHEVLVYTDRYGGRTEFAYYVRHLEAWYQNCCLLIPNVTHWMPLPEPPEEDEE